ncbi:MAG: ATP-binding cassette domain-containing protein [Pirellulales bacterium]|nr:ATP-binding cassette domain-containing protein [Pirellulales bacterium]
MTAHALLELSDVSYQANGARILDGVDWRIERGLHWAVLGRNGAGKTTLLKIACGYIWPNAGGRVLREGVELLDLRALRRSIGWVTSTLGEQIPPREAAVDTVVSGRYASLGLFRLCGERPSSDEYGEAKEMMERFGIADLERRPFGVLSQGERQKTLLARACMAWPMLMILDEPCAGLDPASRESFLAAVEQLAETPDAPTLVLVTHHIEEVMPAFTSTLVLDGGCVMSSGPTREVLSEGLVERLYDGAISKLVWNKGRCWPIGC